MATTQEELNVLLAAKTAQFKRDMTKAGRKAKDTASDIEDAGDKTDDMFDGASTSAEVLKRALNNISTRQAQAAVQALARDLEDVENKAQRLDGKNIDLDTSGGGMAAASAVDGRMAKAASAASKAGSSLGLVAGGATALAAALGIAATAATAVATAGLGGAAVAATIAFEDAADADVATALTDLKAVGRGLAKDFATQMQPVLRNEVVPFLQQLAIELDKIIPQLVDFAEKWMPSVIDALEGWVDNIPTILRTFGALATAANFVWEILEGFGELVAFSVVKAFEGLVQAIQWVAKGVLDMLAGLESTLEGWLGMDLGSPDWKGMKTSVDKWNNSLSDMAENIRKRGQESVDEVMGRGGGPDGAKKSGLDQPLPKSYAAVDEAKSELQAIQRAADAGILEGDKLAKQIEVVKEAMRKADTSDAAFKRLQDILDRLQGTRDARQEARVNNSPEAAGTVSNGRVNIQSKLADVSLRQAPVLNRQLQKLKKSFSNMLTPAVRQFADATAQAFSSAVLEGENFLNVMANILKQLIQKLIAAILKAAALAAIFAALGGGGGFFGNMASALPGGGGLDFGSVTDSGKGAATVKGPGPTTSAGSGMKVQVQGSSRIEGTDIVTSFSNTQRNQRRKGRITS